MRRQAIERLLPVGYQRAAASSGVLTALLDVMEVMHEPDEALLEAVDNLFAPYRAPDHLLPFLARWVALDHVLPAGGSYRESRLPVPIGRLRTLVAEGASLAQWRGTPGGLRRFLELATEIPDLVIEEPPDRPFHIVVRVPQTAIDHTDLIRRLVELEKPAATTCEVVVDQSEGRERNDDEPDTAGINPMDSGEPDATNRA